jgi:hypothetical protein
VATHRSPGEKGAGGQQEGGSKARESDDGIPSIDDAGSSRQPAAGGDEGSATATAGTSHVAGPSAAAQQQADDDIPDISDLALGAAADDEVRTGGEGGEGANTTGVHGALWVGKAHCRVVQAPLRLGLCCSLPPLSSKAAQC